MRIFKLIGALVVVLAFSAVAVATASAAETRWQWLPGSEGETFTAKSGKASLQQEGGATITCVKSLITLPNGQLTEFTEKKDAKGMLVVIDFEECTVSGLAINSEGDPGKTILSHVTIRNCMIKKEHFGLLFLALPIHLEVPSVKLLINVEGSFVGLIEPLPKDELKNHFILNIKQAGGLQEIEKCEGGEKETLKAKVDAEPEFKEAGEEALEGLILFDRAVDKEGETMMEK